MTPPSLAEDLPSLPLCSLIRLHYLKTSIKLIRNLTVQKHFNIQAFKHVQHLEVANVTSSIINDSTLDDIDLPALALLE